jgi:hypothetical protein
MIRGNKIFVGLAGVLLAFSARVCIAGEARKLKVFYTSSEARVTSDACLKSYKDNYGSVASEYAEVPFARLFKSTDNDVLLCIPKDMPVGDYHELKMGAVTVGIGFFMVNGASDKSKCGSLNGIAGPKGFSPILKASSGAQLIDALKIGRINCVYIVESDFAKLLKDRLPSAKYEFKKEISVTLVHMARPAAHKVLEKP